jgi:hypothetical protein
MISVVPAAGDVQEEVHLGRGQNIEWHGS